jgi:hypothetical protein
MTPHRSILAALMVLMLPLACSAREIDIPELGVEFLWVPDQAMEQGVKGSRAGHEATLNIGKAFLLDLLCDSNLAAHRRCGRTAHVHATSVRRITCRNMP